MKQSQQLNESIRLCEQLKEAIQTDCYVDMNKIGGKTLPEYEHICRRHVLEIEKIYKKLLMLQSMMD